MTVFTHDQVSRKCWNQLAISAFFGVWLELLRSAAADPGITLKECELLVAKTCVRHVSFCIKGCKELYWTGRRGSLSHLDLFLLLNEMICSSCVFEKTIYSIMGYFNI